MKKYKFSQLSAKSKATAVHEYREGLIANRDWSDDVDDLPNYKECYGFLEKDLTDDRYEKDGTLIEDEE